MIKHDLDILAQITRYGLLDCQVCVPADWTDEQVLSFAEKKFPCGTGNGWSIRKGGSALLNGDAERVPCLLRVGFVHIMLDA